MNIKNLLHKTDQKGIPEQSLWETARQLQQTVVEKDELIAKLAYALADEVGMVESLGENASDFSYTLLNDLGYYSK